MIRELAEDPNIKDAYQLREAIIKKVMENQSPSDTALAFLKSEVKEML